MNEWAKERGVTFDDHYWPHDGDREDLFLEHGRLAVAQERGMSPIAVERPKQKIIAIEAARDVFPNCDFDEAGTSQGLKRLKHYRKAWDDKAGVWKDRPLHDDNSNGADGFFTFATGYRPPKAKRPRKRQRRTGWAA